MRRDPRRQPYLWKRIAGGADLRPDLEVFSKTGTWGPIFADAGIVRHDRAVTSSWWSSSSRARPPTAGSFIAEAHAPRRAPLCTEPQEKPADPPEYP